MAFNILNFELNTAEIKNNQLVLGDMIRSAVFESHEPLKEFFSHDDHIGTTFLEPMLFHYLMGERSSDLDINQILLGYFPQATTPISITAKSDHIGDIYLPRIGYLHAPATTRHTILFDNINNKIYLNEKAAECRPEYQLQNSSIRLYQHLAAILSSDYNTVLHEPIQNTTKTYTSALEDAVRILKQNVPDFFQAIEDNVRYCSVYNAPEPNSFAGITYHGAAFFNTENQLQNNIFFIDDISHQCGHVIYNALTLDTDDFLNYPKETLLQDIIPGINDRRTIYSAFHGLFTYTCIMHSLHACTINKIFKKEIEQFEVMGRIGFYLLKMIADLENLYNKGIFTKRGNNFFDQFVGSYKLMYNTYNSSTKGFLYDNQPYAFNFHKFQEKHQITTL